MFDILWLFLAIGLGVMVPKYLRYVSYEIVRGKIEAELEFYPPPPNSQEDYSDGEQGQA